MDVAIIPQRAIFIRVGYFGKFMAQARLRAMRVAVIAVFMELIIMQIHDFALPLIIISMMVT